MGSSALLKHLVSIQNKSGAIKPAPHGLMKLKESLQGVPFQLLSPSMSGVINKNNLLSGIRQLAQQLGGFGQVGKVQSILEKLQNGTASVSEMIQAVGDNVALTASLNAYLPQKDRDEIANSAPRTTTT